MRHRTMLLILLAIAAAFGLVEGALSSDERSTINTGGGVTFFFLPTLMVLGGAWLVMWWVRYDRWDRNFTPGTQRCFSCGYSAEGLPSNQCPECGGTWSDTRVWGKAPRARTLIVALAGCWSAAIVVGLMASSVLSK